MIDGKLDNFGWRLVPRTSECQYLPTAEWLLYAWKLMTTDGSAPSRTWTLLQGYRLPVYFAIASLGRFQDCRFPGDLHSQTLLAIALILNVWNQGHRFWQLTMMLFRLPLRIFGEPWMRRRNKGRSAADGGAIRNDRWCSYGKVARANQCAH